MNRISQLKAISEGLKLYSTNHSLPTPDTTSTNIMDNGIQIATQGYAGKNVLETITYSTEGVDPKDKTYYSYYLTQDKKYFQLMAFLEEEENLQNQAMGVDYSTRYPTVYGDKLGILTTSTNEPVQISTGSIDIGSNLSTEYIAHLKDGESISGSGTTFSILTNIASVGGKFCGNDNLTCIDPNIVSETTLNIADIFGDGSNIATYNFDGDVNELNGNYDGTSYSVTYEPGNFGNALSTSGVSGSYVDLGIVDNLELVMSYWGYLTSDNSVVTSFGNGDVNRRLYITSSINGNSRVQLYIQRRDGSTGGTYDYFYCEGNNAISNDGFHHFYVNRSKGTEFDNIYIDGEVATCYRSTYSGVPSKEFTLNINIGFYSYNTENYVWKRSVIDQLRIFNRALTENEIQVLYNE